MEKQAKRLTVFTPTYNRGYILPTLYDALASQTNKNFIWLIVDDGSKDKTEELVKQWAEEGKVEIKYVKQLIRFAKPNILFVWIVMTLLLQTQLKKFTNHLKPPTTVQTVVGLLPDVVSLVASLWLKAG